MNTLDKITLLSKHNRELKHDINTLTKNLSMNNIATKKLQKRLTSLEELLINKFEEVFEGEDSPIGYLEERINKLENT